MDTNFIRKDGFSNPETERLFNSWSLEQVTASVESNQDCGSCNFCSFLVDSPEEYVWLLCLNAKSPHFLETVQWCFCCPKQDRDLSVENLSISEFEPPKFPTSYDKRGDLDLGLEDEHE